MRFSVRAIVLAILLSLYSSVVFAACWDCEAGTYESAEGPTSYCTCDQDEQCADPYTKSTAYVGGTDTCFLSCAPASGTDYCSDVYTLKEAQFNCYCCDEIEWLTIDCRNYGNYKCSDGKCVCRCNMW